MKLDTLKNKHLIKLMSNKVLMLILVASLLILPYIINASNFQLIVAYVFYSNFIYNEFGIWFIT